MLSGAAVLDLRTRRVPNRYWFPFVIVAVAAFVGEALGMAPEARRAILAQDAVAVAMCGFFYLLWRLQLFGGADAKALMVLAILQPGILLDGLPIPPALGTLLLASIAMLLVPVGFLAWNLAHSRTRLPASLLGVPLPLATARASKVWPMQDVDPSGKVRFRYWVRLRGDMEARYAALEAAGLTTVWTTPKVPFFVPLVVGAVAWIWVRHLSLVHP